MPALASLKPAYPVEQATYSFLGTEDLLLGRGFLSLTGGFRGDILGSNASTRASDDFKWSYHIHYLEDYETIRQTLGLSLSASYGMFSGSLNVNQEFEMNSSAFSLLVDIRGWYPPDTVISQKASGDVLRTLREQTISHSFQQIGDQFVSAITKGFRLWINLHFQASDTSDKQRLKAQLKGTYGPFSASAEVQQSMEKMTKHIEADISSIGEGGNIQHIRTIEDAWKAVESFEKEVNEGKKAYPIAYTVTPLTATLVGSGLPSTEAPQLGRSFAWLKEASKKYDEIMYLRSSWKQYRDDPNYHTERHTRIDSSAMALEKIEKSLTTLRSDVVDVQTTILPELPNIEASVKSLEAVPESSQPIQIDVEVTKFSPKGPNKIVHAEAREWVICDTPGSGSVVMEFITEFNMRLVQINEADLSVEYKVRQREGVNPPYETADWVPGGTTLGLHNYDLADTYLNIQGIAIRLKGTLSDNYSVCYQVQNFFREKTAVIRDGVMASVGDQALIALRVWIEQRPPREPTKVQIS